MGMFSGGPSRPRLTQSEKIQHQIKADSQADVEQEAKTAGLLFREDMNEIDKKRRKAQKWREQKRTSARMGAALQEPATPADRKNLR